MNKFNFTEPTENIVVYKRNAWIEFFRQNTQFSVGKTFDYHSLYSWYKFLSAFLGVEIANDFLTLFESNKESKDVTKQTFTVNRDVFSYMTGRLFGCG